MVGTAQRFAMTKFLIFIFTILATLGFGQENLPKATDAVSKAQSTANVTPLDLSLAEAIEKAIAFSPQLSVAELSQLEAEAKLAQARATAVLPEFKTRVLGGPITSIADEALPENGFQNVNFENNFDDLGPFIRIETNILQPLFTFNRIKNLKLAASQGVKVSQLEQRKVRNEVVAQVKEIYWTLIYLDNMRDFMAEISERSEKVQSQVSERLERGSEDVTDIDLMRIKVFKSEMNRRFSEVEANIELAQDSLNIVLGLPRGQKVNLTDDAFERAPANIKPFEHYWRRTQVARPELFQIEAGLNAQDYLVKVKKAEMLPQFFVLGFQRYGLAPNRPDIENPFLDDPFNTNVLGFTFGFEQNFSFNMTNARLREEKAKYKKAQAEARLAKMGIELEVRKAYADLISKNTSFNSALEGYKAGRSWVIATTLNFGAGVIAVEELLQAMVSYSTIKAAYLDTIYKYNLALANLAKVVGEEVASIK